MRKIQILVEHLDDIAAGNSARNYWIVMEQTGDDFLLNIMLVKILSLEEFKPLGFSNKNHGATYRLNLRKSEEGVFIAESPKSKLNKLLLTLCVRCFITAWEHWRSTDFLGLDFGPEIDQERKAWFPPEGNNAAGDLNTILDKTKIVRVLA